MYQKLILFVPWPLLRVIFLATCTPAFQPPTLAGAWPLSCYPSPFNTLTKHLSLSTTNALCAGVTAIGQGRGKHEIHRCPVACQSTRCG